MSLWRQRRTVEYNNLKLIEKIMYVGTYIFFIFSLRLNKKAGI